MWQDLFDKGLITILKKHETSDRCVFLDMFWKYGKKEFPKTFFPKNWGRKKCIEKIMEAFRVAKEDPDSTFINKVLYGRTSEGVLIEIRMLKNMENGTWNINTAFVAQSYFKV